MVRIYNMHGATVRSSKNLLGVLTHYRYNPCDIVVKVKEAPRDGRPYDYDVTFFWPNGDKADTQWADWRVLLNWLQARRSWSIARVTFDAPLFDKHENDERFTIFRKTCAPLTRLTQL
jgi:hypothetical protein